MEPSSLVASERLKQGIDQKFEEMFASEDETQQSLMEASISSDSPTGHKRRHEETSAPDTNVNMPLTPQTPESSNQHGLARPRENEKPVSASSNMGPPAKPRRKSFDENDMPTSGQKETQTPDGSPPPRSTEVKKAQQQKRERDMKVSALQEEQAEAERTVTIGKTKGSHDLEVSTTSELAAQHQDTSEEDTEEEEGSGDEEMEDERAEEEDDESLAPGDPIKSFDWIALEKRHEDMITSQTEEETKLWNEYCALSNVSTTIFYPVFNQLTAQFLGAWTAASAVHERKRAFKRHKTQQYYVQKREEELEDRRKHCKTYPVQRVGSRLLTLDQIKKSQRRSKQHYLCSDEVDRLDRRRRSAVQQTVARIRGFMHALQNLSCSMM